MTLIPAVGWPCASWLSLLLFLIVPQYQTFVLKDPLTKEDFFKTLLTRHSLLKAQGGLFLCG